MVGRVLLLVAAFVVAGLGALLVYVYAQQADARAIAQYEPVQAVVVQGPVAAGTPVATAVEQQLLLPTDVPGANVPDGAVTDLQEVSGLVVTTPLVEGETLVRSRLGGAEEQQRIVIPAGQMAVSFAFEDAARIAGFVAPGSEVAVMLTYDTPDEESGTSDGAVPAPVDQTTEDRTTRVLLDRVQVLAVGATSTAPQQPAGEVAPGEEQQVPVSQTIVTLALTKEQSESMVLGQDIGALYLALRGDEGDLPDGPGVNSETLFQAVGQ